MFFFLCVELNGPANYINYDPYFYKDSRASMKSWRWHDIRVGVRTIVFQGDTDATRGIRFLRNRTSHIFFLVVLLRLQDGFSVTLHLCCCLELILDVEPAPSSVVSILRADGARIEVHHSHNTTLSVSALWVTSESVVDPCITGIFTLQCAVHSDEFLYHNSMPILGYN
jgi:hypothetical protein